MQMRHQPPVDGERIEEFAVGLHRIDRREPQPRELGHVFQNLLHQRTELGRARKIRAIAGEIDARENHFAIAARAEPAHLSDHLAHGHRARIAAAIRDNAEGAAMIATVLHLHECARPAFETIDEVRGRVRHRHDVVDCDFLLGGEEGRSRQTVAMLALEPADGLARLAHRLGRYRAGIDDEGIRKARRLRLTADHLSLIGIEAAAEGDDIDAHWFALATNSAGSNFPSYSKATGPVISTWSSVVRHSIRSSPPRSATVRVRSTRPRRAAATAEAQAAEPHALVSPAPRSHVRRTRCSREATCASETLARSGKIGWFSTNGPILRRSYEVTS